MKYIYKVVSVPKSIGVKKGNNLAKTIAEYIEKIINKMAEDGWEFYRADNYSVEEMSGCIGSLLMGRTGITDNYNLLVFRKEKI